MVQVIHKKLRDSCTVFENKLVLNRQYGLTYTANEYLATEAIFVSSECNFMHSNNFKTLILFQNTNANPRGTQLLIKSHEDFKFTLSS